MGHSRGSESKDRGQGCEENSGSHSKGYKGKGKGFAYPWQGTQI